MSAARNFPAKDSADLLWKYLPVLLLLLNLVLTIWIVFFLHPMETAIFSDMKEYVVRADQISDGLYDLNHFFQPIGYSLWIMLWRYLDAGGWELLKLTHVLLVVLSVYLGWQTARMLLPGKWDLAVLLLLGTNIQWIQLAAYTLSETLFTFFLTALLWGSVRWASYGLMRDAVLVGFLFGLGFFVKGSAVFFPPLLLLWSVICVRHRQQPLRPVIIQLLVMGGCALMIALAHGTYSQLKYGQFKLGADAGGLNFVEGKCPAKHNFDNTGYSWLSPLHYYLGETEEKHWDVPFSDQAYYWQQGWECVKQDPYVLVTSVRYIYYLFAGNPLWPYAEQGKYYELWFKVVIMPLFIIGLIVGCRHWNQPIMMPALLLLSLILVAWIFKSELRFRVPFDAAIMIYAALGARTVWLGLSRMNMLRVDDRQPVTTAADGSQHTQ
jgi:4-amino-4-deoxy-L-arabinose transferase-like glycosyltransferase